MRPRGSHRAIDRRHVAGLAMTTHDGAGEALMETYLSNKHGAGVDIGNYNPELARGVNVEQVGACAGGCMRGWVHPRVHPRVQARLF